MTMVAFYLILKVNYNCTLLHYVNFSFFLVVKCEEVSCSPWIKAIKEEGIIVNEVSVDVN